MTNPHADAARLRKVLRLSLAIQSVVLRNRTDCTPAEYARNLTPAAWKLIGRIVGINEPSNETIAATIAALYESESIGPSSATLLRNVMASQAAVGGARERADGLPSDVLIRNRIAQPANESAPVSERIG